MPAPGRLRRAWRRFSEILVPSSLPDPPHVTAAFAEAKLRRPQLTLRRRAEARAAQRSVVAVLTCALAADTRGLARVLARLSRVFSVRCALRGGGGRRSARRGERCSRRRSAARAAPCAFPAAVSGGPPDVRYAPGSGAKRSVAAARPALAELVERRAAAYRDGVRAFVLGYREAYRDTVLAEAAAR
jgi:hypothetical protein